MATALFCGVSFRFAAIGRPFFFFPFFFPPPPPPTSFFLFFFRTGDATTPRRGVTGAVVAGKRAALVDWLPRAHDSSCVCACACGDLLKIEIGRENTERERVRGCCHGCRRRFETGGSQRPIRAVDRRPARRTRLAANQSRRRASFAWDASRGQSEPSPRVLRVGRVSRPIRAVAARPSRVDASRRLDAPAPRPIRAVAARPSRGTRLAGWTRPACRRRCRLSAPSTAEWTAMNRCCCCCCCCGRSE